MPSRLSRCLTLALALVAVGCAGPERAARDRAWPPWQPSPLGVVPVARPANCGGKPVPPGWPQLGSSRELLAPFLECASPAEFVELQRRANMVHLVERLEPWDAIRLGALGPLLGGSEVLNRKRAEYIAASTQAYGAARAQVFTLFIVHSAFTRDVREVLRLLGEDKRLRQTVGQMPEVVNALARRGIQVSESHDRPERGADVLRGLARAADEALATSDVVGGARGTRYFSEEAQLPPPYAQLLGEIDTLLLFGRPDDVGGLARRGVDALTFGVPLGFYNLVVGTCHGLYELRQGHLEEAARELAAAAVMVALYARGKVGEVTAEAEAEQGATPGRIPELGIEGLSASAKRLLEQLGNAGVVQLAKYIQADGEAALFVLEGGEAGALRLYMANGDVPRARQQMAQLPAERPARPGAEMGKGAGAVEAGLESLVDEAAGYTREVLTAQLAEEEAASPGPRLPRNVEAVRKAKPALERPPAGVAPDSARWREYVVYYERRLAEMEAAESAGTLESQKPPLSWPAYQEMRANHVRGVLYQRAQVPKLQELAKGLGFRQPLIQVNAGVLKADLRFADALIIETDPTQARRVVSVSFKSRNFGAIERKAVRPQIEADASDAHRYYGGNLDIRTPALRRLDYKDVHVEKVYLIYDAEKGLLGQYRLDAFDQAMKAVADRYGVEVRFQ